LGFLRIFFQPDNLILDEKLDDRLRRYKDIEQKHQSNVGARRKQYEDSLANIPKDNVKL
jgi:hypothetical protein